MRRGFSALLMLSALGAVGPMPMGETRAPTSPPPEVPPYPGPLERDLAADPVALSRAEAKRRRRNATRLATDPVALSRAEAKRRRRNATRLATIGACS